MRESKRNGSLTDFLVEMTERYNNICSLSIFFINLFVLIKVPPIYALDTSDVSKWAENVSKTAKEIVTSYIDDTECKHLTLSKQNTNSIPNTRDETYTCEICERIFIGSYQWGQHLNSHRHRRVLEKKKKNETNVVINC